MCQENKDYDRAINAYQFHVQRFHTWTNYYSIFTGALFVGFYSVLKTENQAAVSQTLTYKNDILLSVTNNVAPVSDSLNWFLPLVIAFVGLLSAICWWMSTVGHQAWNRSWIAIVKQNHSIYNEIRYVKSDKVCCTDFYSNINNSTNYIPKFISTEKVTLFFIKIVAISWMSLIAYLIYLVYHPTNLCCFVVGGGVIIIVAFCIIRKIMYCRAGTMFSSNLNGMNKVEIKSKNNKSMKTIIVTQHGQEMGKSHAILAIFEELKKRGAKFNNPDLTKKDEVLAEGKYKSKTIGIESEGDPGSGSRLSTSLKTFNANKCEVIICASRREYPTKDEVLQYRNCGYKIIETSHYFFKESDSIPGTNLIAPNVDLNQLYAKAIVDLVDAVI